MARKSWRDSQDYDLALLEVSESKPVTMLGVSVFRVFLLFGVFSMIIAFAVREFERGSDEELLRSELESLRISQDKSDMLRRIIVDQCSLSIEQDGPRYSRRQMCAELSKVDPQIPH